IAECAAMTGDPSAMEVTRRAVAHSQRMQHPTTGGWRYTAGDPGDLSQLGWQAMLIEAAERAGVEIPNTMQTGVNRFLDSVRGGRGGLARYRPGERISPTMTAEALATRLLLRLPVDHSHATEAEDYLLAHPPGVGKDNLYYWYYASMALHQRQGEAWSEWNNALKRQLLASQNADGSWPTDGIWGGYGGRYYSTAMATLCLEVYYRHER
ncbi:MAG: squalene--hopene cyclase, partial [Planctomycetota bacterium]